MSFFRDKIFTYFSFYDKKTDTNKNVNGAGTLERYNVVIGGDIDDNVKPLIDNLIGNVIMPGTCYERYVPFLESEIGYDQTNRNLRLSDDMTFRRACIKFSNKMANIRGTKKCFRVLFGKIGMSIVITEYNGEFGFDSPITLDDPVRRFDSFCPPCSDYSIDITGVPSISENLLLAFASIIEYNQPINAQLRSISYNGDDLPTFIGDFNIDYNPDFLV